MDDPGDLNVVDGAGGWAVEVSSNRESIKVVPDRSQVLGESVGKSPASFTNVKFVASGANDGVDHVGRYTGEVVVDLEHAGRSINGDVSVMCDVLACVTPATPAPALLTLALPPALLLARLFALLLAYARALSPCSFCVCVPHLPLPAYLAAFYDHARLLCPRRAQCVVVCFYSSSFLAFCKQITLP